MSVAGYQSVAEVWRFETSTDGGHAWQRTDVQLPLGRKRILPDAYASPHAVGPGRLQVLAMADWLPDLPLYLRELRRTHDEKKFHRVPLPWERMPFAGLAFASDGALLLAEVDDAMCSISPPCATEEARSGACHQREAASSCCQCPTLFGPHGSVSLKAGGGVIVAQTGYRTLAVSTDGYIWSEVTPGR